MPGGCSDTVGPHPRTLRLLAAQRLRRGTARQGAATTGCRVNGNRRRRPRPGDPTRPGAPVTTIPPPAAARVAPAPPSAVPARPGRQAPPHRPPPPAAPGAPTSATPAAGARVYPTRDVTSTGPAIRRHAGRFSGPWASSAWSPPCSRPCGRPGLPFRATAPWACRPNPTSSCTSSRSRPASFRRFRRHQRLPRRRLDRRPARRLQEAIASARADRPAAQRQPADGDARCARHHSCHLHRPGRQARAQHASAADRRQYLKGASTDLRADALPLLTNLGEADNARVTRVRPGPPRPALGSSAAACSPWSPLARLPRVARTAHRRYRQRRPSLRRCWCS